MANPVPEHKDKLGRLLSVGEYVAYPDSNNLLLGTIIKLNPKMVKIKPLGRTWDINKYPDDTLKVEGPDLTWYLLKK
jgi:hypothetical protein